MEDAAMGTNQIDSVVDHHLSCDQCPSIFTSLPDLEKHLETHKEERPFKCEQCERSYRHAGSLLNHRKTHEVGLFTCLICQKDFSNPMALKNHLRIHSEEKRFQCSDCGEGFRMSRQLSNHRRAAHSDMNSGYAMVNDEDFGCFHGSPDPSMPLLRENHNLLSNLENYIAESMVPDDFSHLDLKDYPEPDVSSNANDSPADDQQIQSEERRYKCNQCDKAYKHAGSLANHRQSHTIGVYQCVVCFKEFSNMMALKNHSRIHTEYKPYNCTLCDQCFRLPTELASHQKLHTGERPFLCSYCGQSFVSKREFQRHKRLHANVKLEAETGHLRTSEGSENHASKEDAIETSAKIDFYEHPFQEGHKESLPEEPLPNHCDNVKELSNWQGSSSVVPQFSQVNDEAPIKEPCPNDLQSQDETTVSCADWGDAFHDHNSLKSPPCTYADEEGISQPNDHPNPDISHKEEPQSNENSEDRPYKCEQCGRTYRHAGSLINHKKTHQTGVYNCSICTKQLFNMAALKNHLRAHLKKANRGFDFNSFNSTNFLADSFQCTDGSNVCSLCGESFANESDLQLHHTLHEAIKLPTANMVLPSLKKSPLGGLSEEDVHKSKEGDDQTFYLDRPRASEIAIANEIKAIKAIKREMGSESVHWPSQVDETLTVKGPDPGNDEGNPLTAGLTLKREDPCSDGGSPQEAVLGFQSQLFAENHNHTSAEADLSEYEGQGSQDSSAADDRPYKCDLCDRTYRHRGSLVNHKHTHQTGIYQCSICPKQYSNVMALRNHVQVHFRTHLGKSRGGFGEAGGGPFSQGMEKFYSCTMCGEAFEDQMDWHAHQLMHISQKELQDYQNANDLQEDSKNSIYGGCHVYATADASQREDPSQYREGHGQRDAECAENVELAEEDGREEAKMSHICGQCGHIFDDVGSLQVHALLHEGEDMPSAETPDETKQVAAAKCEIDPAADGGAHETSEQMESLVGGLDGHTEKRMYECGLCDKSYRHSGSLINHKRTHQMGDYACAVCSKQFNNLAALKNHLRSHQRSKRERRFENSDHPSLLSPESSFSEAAFRGTDCDESLSSELELGSHHDQHSGTEATDADTSPGSPQSKMLKDLAEDIRTLHNPVSHQESENDSAGVNRDEPMNASRNSFPDDAGAKQIRPGLKLEDKSDEGLEDGVHHHVEEANHILQQGHKIEGGAKNTSPDGSPLQTDPSAPGEGPAEGSPDVGGTEERPYKCEECGKTYRHAGSLINHKHTHQTGIYQCSFCPKEYPNVMALRNHFRTHTRPQFNRSREASGADFFGLPGEIHQPRSGEELYDCSLCGLVFSNEGEFHQHQIVHGNSEATSGLENARLQKGLDGGQCDSSADGRFAESATPDYSFHLHAVEKQLLSRLKQEMKDQGDVQDGAYFSESHLSHICGHCGKTYDDLKSLEAHSLSHSDENAAAVEEVTGCFDVDFDKLNLHVNQLPEPEGPVNISEMFAKTNFLIDDPKTNEGPERRPYACNQCEKTYRHGGSLVNHKKTHQIGDYQCSGCSRQYPNLAAYRNHLRHHPKCKELVGTIDLKVFQASSEGHYPVGSGEMFGHSSGINDSWKELHQLYNNAMAQEEYIHPAEMATEISNIEDSATEVTKASHHAEHGDEGLLGDNAVDHKSHVAIPAAASANTTGVADASEESDASHTVDTKPQICDLCCQLCDGAVGLENHKTLVCTGHPKEDLNVVSSDPGSLYTSNIPTSADFESTDHLNDSQGFVEGPFHHRPFKCEVCGRSYRHAGSLINHKQTHTTGLFPCSVCQKRFFNMMALKNHNRIHFEMKRYKCPDCGKAFRLQKQMLTHQKMHRDRAALVKRPNRHGKREVKVPIRLVEELDQMDRAPSGASSTSQPGNDKGERKVNLKRRHAKKTLNPDERPYRCEQCGRSYRHAGSLLNHKRSHTTGQYSCSICDKTYPNLMAMKNHQRIHVEVKSHMCSECGKAFKWRRQLARHQLLHTRKPHVCDLCGQAFQRKSLFEKHQLEHGNSQSDGLPGCAGDLPQEHPARDTLEKPLKIQVTSRRTGVARRRIRIFRSDFGKARKKLVIQDCEPSCQACKLVFNSYEELEAHHCEHPSDVTPVTDTLPVQTTHLDSDGTALSFNQKLEDETLKQEDTGECPHPGQVEERPYKCNMCERTYRHAGSLLNHKNTHTTGLFKCFVCLKQFFNSMAIKNHLRIHTAKKRFQCQECGKAFRSSRELITHHRVHTGERPFNCPVCHRGFSSKLSLKQHQQVHNSVRARDQDSKASISNHMDAPSNGLVDGASADDPTSNGTPAEERPYKCDQCDRAYRHAGSLLNHKKTHKTGVYHCPTCHKQFFNLLAMKNHLRIHLDQNRYKCLDCGKAFRVSSRLASHRWIHAQGGPFSCPLCAKKFFRKSTFQRHQLLHKGGEGILPQDGMAPKVLVEVT